LPGFYRAQFRRRLGGYADLLTEEDLTPVLTDPAARAEPEAGRSPARASLAAAV
jgi:hypothetical protein